MKYLPGIKLGKNVVADPDLENAGTSFLSKSCAELFEVTMF